MLKRVVIMISLALLLAGCITSSSDKDDKEVRDAVIRSVSSAEFVQNLCDLVAVLQGNDPGSLLWDARTEDPEDEIWTVECLIEKKIATPTGKTVQPVTLLSFLYDIEEQRLYIQRDWALLLTEVEVDFTTSPPSVKVPYLGSQ